MTKDRLISETCDFGVVYSLFLKQAGQSAAPRRVIVKVSWEEEFPGREAETRSSVFELNLMNGTMRALGRKGNQLSAERFCVEKICTWARLELAEYDCDS